MAQLTYRQAAVRVRRSVKTIKRWRRQGMPMGWGVEQGQKVRLVEEAALLAAFRAHLQADPVHQARMRAAQATDVGKMWANAPT